MERVHHFPLLRSSNLLFLHSLLHFKVHFSLAWAKKLFLIFTRQNNTTGKASIGLGGKEEEFLLLNWHLNRRWLQTEDERAQGGPLFRPNLRLSRCQKLVGFSYQE